MVCCLHKCLFSVVESGAASVIKAGWWIFHSQSHSCMLSSLCTPRVAGAGSHIGTTWNRTAQVHNLSTVRCQRPLFRSRCCRESCSHTEGTVDRNQRHTWQCFSSPKPFAKAPSAPQPRSPVCFLQVQATSPARQQAHREGLAEGGRRSSASTLHASRRATSGALLAFSGCLFTSAHAHHHSATDALEGATTCLRPPGRHLLRESIGAFGR